MTIIGQSQTPGITQDGQVVDPSIQPSSVQGLLIILRSCLKNALPSPRFSASQVMGSAQNLQAIPHVRPSNPSNPRFNNAPSSPLHMSTKPQQFAPSASIAAPTPKTDAQVARSFVLRASVEELESLGAGELTRLSKIMNADTNPSSQITDNFRPMAAQSRNAVEFQQTLVLQETQIESKLQKAFVRAYNSTQMSPGAKGLEKLLIDKHSSLSEGPAPLTAQSAHEIAHFIALTDGRDLQNLTKRELSFIGHKIHNADNDLTSTSYGNQAMRLINQAFETASDEMKLRKGKTRHPAAQFDPGIIRHRTTLFAKLHQHASVTIATDVAHRSPVDQQAIQADLSKIMLRAAHNHVSPQQVRSEVTQLLQTAQISVVCQQAIFDSMDKDIKRFQPSDNLGLQMESPHAIKMENDFAASVIDKPTLAMQKVGQKMVAQIKAKPEYFNILMQAYLAKGSSYIYPIAQSGTLSPQELQMQLESGSNLALAMDFNHFVIDDFMQAPFMKANSGEVAFVRDQKTYSQHVNAYRGERVPLPQLDSVQNKQSAIGVGTNENTVHLQKIQVAVNRPSTVKTAFGTHARESANADVAQGSGTTGRGNIHLFGQAAINQSVPPHLRFSQEETQVYLVMLGAVMTADGGHTLSEILATTFIASQNVGDMTSIAKPLVSDMFQHMANITSPMANPNTRFNQFDMVFSSIQDQETHDRLTQVWNNIARSA